MSMFPLTDADLVSLDPRGVRRTMDSGCFFSIP